jgi:Na+/H+ antiporter NhaA
MAISVGGCTVSLTLDQRINDGSITVFFLLVGLAIRARATR